MSTNRMVTRRAVGGAGSVSNNRQQKGDVMKKITILALDLGTKTGWAVRYGSGEIHHGVDLLKAGRFEGGGMQFVRFRIFLNEMLKVGVARIYFEEVRAHVGTTAAQMYGGFLGNLTGWCEEQKIPYQGVPVGTIKKHATGKGNASKAEVIEAMLRKGHRPNDDNDADALAILYWALDQ